MCHGIHFVYFQGITTTSGHTCRHRDVGAVLTLKRYPGGSNFIENYWVGAELFEDEFVSALNEAAKIGVVKKSNKSP